MEEPDKSDRRCIEDILHDQYLTEFTQKEKHGKLKVLLKVTLPSPFSHYEELKKYLVGNSVPITGIKLSEWGYGAHSKEYKGGSKEAGFYTLESSVEGSPRHEFLRITTSRSGCDPDMIYGLVDALRQYVQLYDEEREAKIQLYNEEMEAKKKQSAAA